jgi:hypothetical protein
VNPQSFIENYAGSASHGSTEVRTLPLVVFPDKIVGN